MLVGISTKKLCEERGVETWEYSLECPNASEGDNNAFCGTFTVDVRAEIDEAIPSVYFNWFWADYDKTVDNLEAMKAWVEDRHDELESALNKGYIEIG